MQRAPSLRKPRSDVRLSARHLGTRFLWKDTKIRLKTVVGMHRNHLATCSLCLKVSTQNQFLQINLIWWLLLLLSYCCIVTRKLFFCVFCEYLCLFLCLTCVAMVLLLSPHAVPVVSSLWIRVLVRDAEHSLPLPRRWSPADAGPLFHWTCRKCSSIVTTIPAHRKTPEARTTATVAATEVTAAHLLWKTIPTFYISFLLALALSDSVTL